MRSSALVLAAAGILAASSMAMANIPNGDFGGFTMGTGATALSNIPNGGWIPTTANGTLSSQSTDNSPFTNAYADNDSSWLSQDATTGGYNSDPAAHTAGWGNFGNLGGNFTTSIINFDFKVDSLVSGGQWGVQFNNDGPTHPVNPGGASSTIIYFKISDSFITRGQGGADQTVISSLTAGTWYNVQATVDAVGGTYSGTITPDGGSAVPFSFSDLNLGANGDKFVAGVQVRDRSASGVVNAGLSIDNLRVVPEPASLSLLALGGLFLTRRRK